MKLQFLAILAVLLSPTQVAAAQPLPKIAKVFVVVLENEDESEALAQPFLKQLARDGASLKKFHALTRPSQPNYLALVSGDTHGIASNENVTVDSSHLGDLLEAKGKSWKVYAEGFPGDCFLGAKQGVYVRKHLPFLSFKNIQENPARCKQHIVSASELTKDVALGKLPDFSLYIPDNESNGHDTGVKFASQATEKTFKGLLRDPKFIKDTLFIVTFDEDSKRLGAKSPNQVYTTFFGSSVKAGTVSDDRYDLYDLLRTIEDLMGLGNLGRKDAEAKPITGIWK